MNTKSTKLLKAAGLVLALSTAGLGTAQAANLSHSGKTRATGNTVDLGTIVVTPADALPVPGVVDLGTIRVTPSDTRLADHASAGPGVVSLGTIVVTPADSAEARIAARSAEAQGKAFLGTILITSANAETAAPVIAAHSLRGAVLDALAALRPGKFVSMGYMFQLVGHVAAGL